MTETTGSVRHNRLSSTLKPSLERRLITLQAVGGALFFVFLAMHLSNTALASVSADAYNGYQRWLRDVYQHPILEFVLVIGPLLAHSVAGVWLHLIRKNRQMRRPLRQRLHTWAGFFLLLVVIGHALATRGIAYWFGAIPEFAGVSFSLWWVPAYFYPYYFLLFMAGLYHGSMGIELLLRRFTAAKFAMSDRLRMQLMSVGAIAAMLALLGFGGHLFEIHDPRDNDYARQYSELFGVDLGTTLP